MNSNIGAKRPAFTRKRLLLIAVAAIVLVFAWARAGFPCPPCPTWLMGPDGMITGPVEGMMPPNYRTMPTNKIVHEGPGGPYTYEKTETHGGYTISRNGKRWVSLILNKSTGLYELSDPNGTGWAVVKIGTPKKVGPILKDSGPSSTH